MGHSMKINPQKSAFWLKETEFKFRNSKISIENSHLHTWKVEDKKGQLKFRYLMMISEMFFKALNVMQPNSKFWELTITSLINTN